MIHDRKKREEVFITPFSSIFLRNYANPLAPISENHTTNRNTQIINIERHRASKIINLNSIKFTVTCTS